MWLPLLGSVPKSKPRHSAGRSLHSAPADPGPGLPAVGGIPVEGVSPHASEGEGMGQEGSRAVPALGQGRL